MQVFMAAVAICYKTPYMDQNLPTQSVIRQNGKRLMYESVNMPRSFSSFPGQICQSCYPSYKINNILTKTNTKEGNAPKCIIYGGGFWCIKELIHRHSGPNSRLIFIQGSYSKWKDLSRVRHSAESSFMEKQLRLLDSYFGKLQDNANSFTFDSSNKAMEVHQADDQSRSKNGLESLDDYLGKVNNGVNQESRAPSTYVEHYSEDKLAPKPASIRKDTERANFRKQKTYVNLRRIRGIRNPRSAIDSQQDQTSSLYLIGTLASVNIAVFLFEIASPIRNADFELFSLPLLYGAKINHLIVLGEWWRLVTPMFLHAGIFHMALSCWALLSFGPQVCRGYGSFNFFLIYILGGFSGNLTSFLHTADPTVGGTGPVFAIIGAWLMYQIQNTDVIASEASENMFQKAIIVTALGFVLSNLGPIDQWTHLGAAFTGMAYGFLTSPILQLDDAASSGTGQEEGLKLVRQYGDSCKSLILFTIFIFVLSLFLFYMEPPLTVVTAEDLEYM